LEHLDFIRSYVQTSIETKERLLNDESMLKLISEVSNIIIAAYKRGNKVILAGNGGSAADAQHIAAEFVSRFFFDRPGLPAMSLTTDTSMLTAIGNDYGFDQLFARQLQAQSREGDIFIGISTSGNSENIINAMDIANGLGVTKVVLCGESGKLKDQADYAICVPSSITPYIQECHICIGHMICAIVEKQIFNEA